MRLILLALTVLSVFSCHGTPDNNQAIPNEEGTLRITGRVEVYGNEPFTFVGIVDENNIEYAVYPREKEDELRRLQGHLIVFTVIKLDEPRGEGGMYLRGGTVTPISWEILPN